MNIKILIIDGHSLAYRAYHAGKMPLNAPDGTPTTMIVLFINMLFKVIDEQRPSCIIVVFDSKQKTFRHELLSGYKADRKASPDDFRFQIPILQELLNFLGYKVVTREGIEADDLAASIIKLAKRENHQILILSSDKDLMQLLSEGVEMLRLINHGITEAEIYNSENFQQEYGFMPSSMADYLAMTGDSSDNIKGIEGLGDKSAKKILAKFSTLEEIFAGIDEFPEKSIRTKLKNADKEYAIWLRDNIIKLKDNIFDDDENFLNNCLYFEPDLKKAEELASKLGLKRVLQRLGVNTRVISIVSPKTRGDVSQETERFTSVDREVESSYLLTLDYKTELRKFPEKFADKNSKDIWDLRTAHYLLHPDESEKIFPKLLSEVNYENLRYYANDFESKISKYEGLHDVMTDIDIPLIPVLNKMEDHGIRIDFEKFSKIQDELNEKIFELENEIENLTGAKINVNSPKQVSWLLFERLGFEPIGMTKGKTNYSTDSNVLEKLSKLPDGKGKIPGLILEHREISKMLSGFVIPLQRAGEINGIIHTTFDPAMTGTGRLSSRDPNLQNIPAFGQWAEKIKSGLIPVDPENIFVSADYSQIELRVLAYLSNEEKLIEAFNNNRDIHSETASWVFDTAPEFVTPELRRAAKMINFGLIYGMSSFGLAERLGISRNESKEIMKKYFEALPGIQDYFDKIVSEAKSRGYTKTFYGRIRPVLEIPAKGSGLDRALINSPIQGTAADIARKAMINFEREVNGKLFLQVHDSLVCECKETEADEISEKLQNVMKTSGGEINHLEVQVKKSRSLNNV